MKIFSLTVAAAFACAAIIASSPAHAQTQGVVEKANCVEIKQESLVGGAAGGLTGAAVGGAVGKMLFGRSGGAIGGLLGGAGGALAGSSMAGSIVYNCSLLVKVRGESVLVNHQSSTRIEVGSNVSVVNMHTNPAIFQ